MQLPFQLIEYGIRFLQQLRKVHIHGIGDRLLEELLIQHVLAHLLDAAVHLGHHLSTLLDHLDGTLDLNQFMSAMASKYGTRGADLLSTRNAQYVLLQSMSHADLVLQGLLRYSITASHRILQLQLQERI
jgi:hypothetical protein